MNQFLKMIVEDYPRLKVKEVKILFISRLFLSFLILLTVSFIIGDLFFDITKYFLAVININDESIKFIKTIKYFLMVILKPLLIYINYRLHGIKSWKFWITIISAIFFVSFLIISFSSYWNLTIYQEISAFIITLSISLVSLSNFGDLGVCNMVPKGSTHDISSKNENIGESKSQKDNSNSDKNKSNYNKNQNDSKSGNKRKVEVGDLDDKNTKKRIRKNNVNKVSRPNKLIEPVRDARWWDDFNFFCQNWSPEALKMAREEICNDMNKDSVIRRLGHINKTILDVTNILMGKPPVHNYFKVENLPRMVSLEDAKREYEMDRRILRRQLRVIENIEWDEWRCKRFLRARNKHFDIVKDYIGKDKSGSERRRLWTIRKGKSIPLRFPELAKEKYASMNKK